MEINFETLKRCNNCRFEAEYTDLNCDQNEQTGVPIHGMVHVPDMDDDIDLLFSQQGRFTDWRIFYDRCGHKYARHITDVGFETTFLDHFLNFRIVPRDPETYKDWQVGDRVAPPDSDNDNNYVIVIFRAGELVVSKRRMGDGRWEGYSPYTCEELFEKGWRLVLADIEKQMIEERKQASKESHEFKKYDPVLVRDTDDSCWRPAVFKQIDPLLAFPFSTIDGNAWKQCVPLNDNTIKYLHTTINLE